MAGRREPLDDVVRDVRRARSRRRRHACAAWFGLAASNAAAPPSSRQGRRERWWWHARSRRDRAHRHAVARRRDSRRGKREVYDGSTTATLRTATLRAATRGSSPGTDRRRVTPRGRCARRVRIRTYAPRWRVGAPPETPLGFWRTPERMGHRRRGARGEETRASRGRTKSRRGGGAKGEARASGRAEGSARCARWRRSRNQATKRSNARFSKRRGITAVAEIAAGVRGGSEIDARLRRRAAALLTKLGRDAVETARWHARGGRVMVRRYDDARNADSFRLFGC